MQPITFTLVARFDDISLAILTSFQIDSPDAKLL
jgi:hypothetical protein